MTVLDILKQLIREITAPDLIISLTGLILLGCWLVRTSLGRKALADSLPRPNSMPLYLPFIPLCIWVLAVWCAMEITEKFMPDLQSWKKALVDNISFLIAGMAAIAVIISSARAYFIRRLKGFGLNPKTIPKDFFTAILNLLSIWPLVTLALALTMLVGWLIQGPDFQIHPHEELESIAQHSQLSVRISIILVAVVIAPVFEELLFRGLFQTMICSVLRRPWPSIVLSSILFIVLHPDKTHWPALFVLAMCLGYSYEKSGSLLRPIFIHALFNAATVIAALTQ